MTKERSDAATETLGMRDRRHTLHCPRCDHEFEPARETPEEYDPTIACPRCDHEFER